LLSYLVGTEGRVFATEKIPELVDLGRRNCEKTGSKNVAFFQAGGALGLPEYAPYGRILVSAGAEALPKELVDQLKPGGTMVIPVRGDVLEITKDSSGNPDIISHPGFLFVPLM
jgi:protein-L-isoaspartate(D-aspartate) O-methyltransferase